MSTYLSDNYHGYNLRAIEEFWNLTPVEIAKIAHGCGPGSGWKEKIIPDTILGVCITPACNIHDVEYYFGDTSEDKEEADLNLIHNALLINNKDSKFWIFKSIRRKIILGYYEAVSDMGVLAFWTQDKLEALKNGEVNSVL